MTLNAICEENEMLFKFILHFSKVLFTTVFGISNFIMLYVIRIVLPSCLSRNWTGSRNISRPVVSLRGKNFIVCVKQECGKCSKEILKCGFKFNRNLS